MSEFGLELGTAWANPHFICDSAGICMAASILVNWCKTIRFLFQFTTKD